MDLPELEEAARDLSGVLVENVMSKTLIVKARVGTYCHLSVLAPLVRSYANRGLKRALNIALVCIHIEQLGPWLGRVARGI